MENNVHENLIKVFGLKTFNTISNIENRIRINLATNCSDKDRLDIAFNEVSNILKSIFNKKEIIVRLCFWNKKEELKDLKSSLIQRIESEDNIVLVLKYNSLNDDLLNIIKMHLNFELGLSPSINIGCFLFNFEIPILLNIYDDRGLDIIPFCKE